MFRKTLIFATVVLALVATHAEDVPKITHKVRAVSRRPARRDRTDPIPHFRGVSRRPSRSTSIVKHWNSFFQSNQTNEEYTN
jgi:hypothetical protein